MTAALPPDTNSRQKLEVLLNISRALGEEIRLDNLLPIMVAEVTRAMQAERSSLFVHDPAKGELFTKVAEGMQSMEIRVRVGVGIVGMTAATRSTINIPDAYQDSRFNPSFDKASGFVTRSILSMPIFSQNNEGKSARLLGIVQVLNKRDHSTFTHEDEEFLQAICVHLALAFERVELVESYVRAQKTAQDMKWARRIQMGLLPGEFSLPQWPELDLHAVLATALDVGGDLYDFFPLDEHRLFFVLGDVSGKGLPAALFMAMTHMALRSSVLSNPDDIAATLDAVNKLLCHRNESGMFVTMFCGVLDVRTGIISYADGGHEPPWIVRANGSVERLDKVGGLVIGLLPSAEYEPGTIELGCGDALIIFTDGVTEALNPGEEMFEISGLKRCLAPGESKHLVDSVLNAVHQFADGAPQSDDITIFALRRRPVA